MGESSEMSSTSFWIILSRLRHAGSPGEGAPEDPDGAGQSAVTDRPHRRTQTGPPPRRAEAPTPRARRPARPTNRGPEDHQAARSPARAPPKPAPARRPTAHRRGAPSAPRSSYGRAGGWSVPGKGAAAAAPYPAPPAPG